MFVKFFYRYDLVCSLFLYQLCASAVQFSALFSTSSASLRFNPVLLVYDSHLAGVRPPFIITLSNRIDKLVKTRLARGGSDLTKDVPDETVTAL
jgi:hypothetical protein